MVSNKTLYYIGLPTQGHKGRTLRVLANQPSSLLTFGQQPNFTSSFYGLTQVGVFSTIVKL